MFGAVQLAAVVAQPQVVTCTAFNMYIAEYIIYIYTYIICNIRTHSSAI